MRPDDTTKALLFVIAVALCIIASRPLLTPDVSYAGRTVQYKVVNTKIENPSDLEADLDRLGNEGWQLITYGFGPMIFYR